MKKSSQWLLNTGVLLLLLGVGLASFRPVMAAVNTPTAVSGSPQHGNTTTAVNDSFSHDFYINLNMASSAEGACEVKAVDLIGAWVDAGAENGSFPFTSLNDEACTGTFENDVLPLFTTPGAWYEGSQACIECHFDNSADSRHEMDLSSYEGIMRGGDVLSEPPGVPIVIPGDWSSSKLRARLRNNRMPPGWEFDIEETNRDGPLLTLDGGEITAVDLIGAWVDAGAENGSFPWTDASGNEHTGTFADDIQPLFTTENAWFEGSQACIECHFDNSADSRHEMDLSSYEGMMRGGDVLSDPPGVPIIIPGDWSSSKLRARLRNNRMPPGWEFDIEETNRDGPTILAGQLTANLSSANTCDINAVDLIGAWVDAGAENGSFPFTSLNDEACTGTFEDDVLPLFTTPGAWYEGSQACTECHFDNSADSRHEMDLSSYEGIMRGGDVLSEPPGVPIVIPGDWSSSKLRARLRNNRMPPGWEFDIEETNRDGPLLTLDGGEITAVDLIGAWVDAGAENGSFPWTDASGNEHTGTFADDIQPLFTTENAWFEGSQACTECHFDNSADSRHEMDLSSYEGMMRGGDVLSEPPGVPIIIPGDWSSSKLRARLRNNRMPPGWEFDIEETNRDGPVISVGTLDSAMSESMAGTSSVLSGECQTYAVDLIGAWVDAGAENGTFPFSSTDGAACAGSFETDILPLFTTENAWYEGSQACTECHFDNSADSRHEMDLSSYEGIMRGGDVLSDPPGVPIVVPGDWGASKLKARLRNNRMPPGWEFDIEETNRDGPLLTLDGSEITAVDLIGAWVDAGAENGSFPWTDASGNEHTGTFADDIQPLFTTENAWFEGSQACTECHFDNSADSRHEMDLSSYEGMMRGGDVLSEPPGVPIIIPGDWSSSKLRARLRNNRMPPGWEFDIEETNRDGPMVMAGVLVGESAPTPELISAEGDSGSAGTESAGAGSNTETAVEETAVTPPELPEPTVTIEESVKAPATRPLILGVLGGLTMFFGVVIAFVAANKVMNKPEEQSRMDLVQNSFVLVFAILAVFLGSIAVNAVTTDSFTKTVTIHEKVPYAVEVAPVTSNVAEVRIEDWQARLPEEYANLTNPFAGNPEAVAAGQQVFFDNDCQECHGPNLQGDGEFSSGLRPKPVNLTDPALMNLPFITDAYLFWRVSEGGRNAPFQSAMPAWKEMLTEEERWQVVTFIRSQTAETASESTQAAVAIIEQAGCFACHRSETLGRGGKIGPAWDPLPEVAGTRVPGMSAEEYVLQSIIDPQAFTVEGFEDKAELMPTDFGSRLSEDELNLLVDFLLGKSDEE